MSTFCLNSGRDLTLTREHLESVGNRWFILEAAFRYLEAKMANSQASGTPWFAIGGQPPVLGHVDFQSH